MKLIIVLVSVLSLSACSTKPTIHLYSKYLTEKDINELSEEFVAHDYKVELNKLNFPNSIGTNSLVYTPSSGGQNTTSHILSLVTSQGFTIDTASLILASNHSFSANHMGLYLISSEKLADLQGYKNSDYQIPLINEYTAKNCLHSSTLILKRNGQFRIEEEQWLEAQQDYSQTIYTGQWEIKEKSYLFLKSNQWQQTLIFERSSFSRTYPEGNIEGYQFVPLTSYSQKTSSGGVYCTYEISQVME